MPLNRILKLVLLLELLKILRLLKPQLGHSFRLLYGRSSIVVGFGELGIELLGFVFHLQTSLIQGLLHLSCLVLQALNLILYSLYR